MAEKQAQELSKKRTEAQKQARTRQRFELVTSILAGAVVLSMDDAQAKRACDAAVKIADMVLDKLGEAGSAA